MSVVTLGLAGAVGHDPAAALFVDNKLVAAVEEERLIRRKHAKGELPYPTARQSLQIAGLRGAATGRIGCRIVSIAAQRTAIRRRTNQRTREQIGNQQ